MNPINRRTMLRGAGAAVGAIALSGHQWTPALADPGTGAVVDSVVFGDTASETAHSVSSTYSNVVAGQLGQPARVLNPQATPGWWGGTVAASLEVDPAAPNYVTVKFWGGDQSPDGDHCWRLQLFVDGKAVGWFDQAVVDNIDAIDVAPRLPGRFFCHTLPLPLAATAGKRSLTVEIRAMGRIWPYGQNSEQFYYPMTTPSRGIYRAYVHTDPYFVPAAGDEFGTVGTPGTRASTDDEMIAKIKARVLGDQTTLLYSATASSMDAWAYMTLLGGYYWSESPAYQNPDTLEKVCEAIDGRYLAWQQDAKVLTDSDQQWEGFGRVGLALSTGWDDLQEALDRNVTSGPLKPGNLGFEAGTGTPYGWSSPGWASNGTFSRDTSVARSGSASLKITSSGGSMLVTSGRGRTGPGTITCSAWVKTDGTAKTPHVLVQLWDDSNTFITGSGDTYGTAGGTGWQQITATVQVPANATQYEFWIAINNGETANVDDVEITAPDPVSSAAVPRRKAYRDMMVSSREYWRQHQRHYTNQAQFTAIGIYECNRGLALLSPADAWPEADAKSWLYQSVGLEPWKGPQDADGNWLWTLGHDYYCVTPKGLSRELGYVADYGEIQGMLARIYEAVSGGKGGAEDPKLKARMIEMCQARGWFRHPAADPDGNACFRIETQIGWRNEPFPGDMVYAERTAWDETPITAAAVLGDATLAGWCNQMIADGQFAPQLELLVSTSLYTRVGLSAFSFVTRHLPALQKMRSASARLPGGWNERDFVFTDEGDACIAVKRGEELFYSSLYYRARQGVNDLARVHLLTPQSERSATVRETSVFDKAHADTYTVQDWVCWDFAINDSGNVSTIPAGGFAYPGPTLHQSFAGEKFYRAPVPADVPDPALGSTTLGVETVLVGKAPFYFLEYAGYLVAMNTTKDQTFTYRVPGGGSAVDLRTGRTVGLGQTLTVGPLSTVVLYSEQRRRSQHK